MKITFDLGAGKQEVDRIGLGDMVAFERHFNLPATVMEPETEVILDSYGEPVVENDDKGRPVLDEEGQPVYKVRILGEQRMEWIAFLVWRSARRQGLIAADSAFDDAFLDKIVDFGMHAEESDNSSGEDPAAETRQ